MRLPTPGPVLRTLLLATLIVILAVAGEWYVATVRGGDEVTCQPQGTAQAVLTGLSEASGVAVSRRTPGTLWTLNDGGDAVITAVDERGARQGRVRVAGAQLRDWEAIAVAGCGQGRSCLYIGDIGDNEAKRSHIVVYRVPEPAPGDETTAAVETFAARFPDQAHDAEALFITPDGVMFIVTKERPAGVFKFPADAQAGTVSTLQQVGFIPTEDVTDAAASPDGRWVALRTKEVVMFFRAGDIVNGEIEHGAPVPVVSLGEPQGEGVAIGANGNVYLAGESGRRGRPGTLATMSCVFPAERSGAAAAAAATRR
jgi:hypothetical protein